MMDLSIKCKNRRDIRFGQEQSRDIDFGGLKYIYVILNEYILSIYNMIYITCMVDMNV